MAASMQDHFHLMTSAPEAAETTGEWYASAKDTKPSMVPETMVFASPRYGLSGKLYPHVLQSGADPVQKTNWQFQVLFMDETATGATAYADFLTWLAYAGKEMYFVPNYHDPSDHQSYMQYIYVERIGRAQVEGYKYDVIELPVQILDNES